MSEVIVVEAVTDKYKNKYNSGSVLTGGKWIQVASKVDLNLFKKDSEMTVETVTNAKGYKSIVGIVEDAELAEMKEASAPAPAPVRKRAAKAEPAEGRSYDEAKNRKILVQGITQAVAQSPSLASLPGTTVEEVVETIKQASLMLIQFVDEQSK